MIGSPLYTMTDSLLEPGWEVLYKRYHYRCLVTQALLPLLFMLLLPPPPLLLLHLQL